MNLEELKKLCAESVTLDGPDDGQFEYATGPWHDQTNGNTDLFIATALHYDDSIGEYGLEGFGGDKSDALFIAAAREALPKLIAVAEAAFPVPRSRSGWGEALCSESRPHRSGVLRCLT